MKASEYRPRFSKQLLLIFLELRGAISRSKGVKVKGSSKGVKSHVLGYHSIQAEIIIH